MLVLCGACQATNTPKSRFCQKCGNPLPTTSEGGETTVPLVAGLTQGHEAVTADFVPEAVSPEAAPAIVSALPLPESPPLSSFELRPDPVEPATDVSTHHEPGSDPSPPPVSRPSPPSADSNCPISLGLSFDRVFVAENPSTFEILVENHCETPLENVEILFESARALGSSLRFGFKRIAPAKTLRRRIEIEPLRAGNFVLQCSVVLEMHGEKHSFIGSQALRVNAVPDTSNISINVSDILNNTDQGANAGLGKELKDNKVTTNIDMSRIKTLNDLLDLELPENFQFLDLQLDYQLSIASINVVREGLKKTLIIPRTLTGTCQTGSVLRLQPTASGGTELILVTGTRFTFGRKRKEADYLAWFWPRSEANDAKSKRISGLQAIAEAHEGRLVVRDGPSANGTTYNGLSLDAESSQMLDRRGTLAFAAEYELDVLHVPSRLEKGPPAISNVRLWSGPAETEMPRLGAVRFSPINTEPTPASALWLLSDAEFGSSHSNPIIIADPTLSEIQGRFLHWRGCFWLENGVANQSVSIDDTQLAAGNIAPLATGQHIRLGQTIYRAEVGAPQPNFAEQA